MSSKPQVVLCTVPDAGTAETIAGTLVAESLAACVNIIPGITSIYRWKGVIENDRECLLLIKTAANLWPLIEQRIRSIHPYELPEIIAVSVETGQKDYIKWLTDNLKRPD
jgi:periplasmic divalent cation tolerance protein